MSRPLTVFLPVSLDSAEWLGAALATDPATWLPDGQPTDDDRWKITLWLGRMRRDVVCDIGPVRDEVTGVWRPLSWTPMPHRRDPGPVHELLPSFRGEIGLHRDQSVLVIDGTYEVPGGIIGEMADAVALQGASRATVSRFLADIARLAGQAAPMVRH